MQWCEKYSIGIDEIDRQHKILFDFFTQVDLAISDGGRWPEIHFPLVRLREYSRLHFGAEESLMRMADYPGVERHAKEHHGILQKLQSLENRSLHADVTAEMTQFLRDQLIRHILHQDMDYARHFANGGRIAVRKPSPAPEQTGTELPVDEEKGRNEADH